MFKLANSFIKGIEMQRRIADKEVYRPKGVALFFITIFWLGVLVGFAIARAVIGLH